MTVIYSHLWSSVGPYLTVRLLHVVKSCLNISLVLKSMSWIEWLGLHLILINSKTHLMLIWLHLLLIVISNELIVSQWRRGFVLIVLMMVASYSLLVKALTCTKMLDARNNASYLLNRLRLDFIAIPSRRNSHLEVLEFYIDICYVPKGVHSTRCSIFVLVAIHLLKIRLIRT
jgi:hypothetical protein